MFEMQETTENFYEKEIIFNDKNNYFFNSNTKRRAIFFDRDGALIKDMHYLHDPNNVFLENEDITGLPPHQLFNKGLLRTFQIAHEFHSMTCRENLMMVPNDQSGEKLWNTWFGRKRIADEERALKAKADEVLEFLTIDHLADHKAGQVSGGQKKLLELGRTMMVDARIVFLDEVGAGVNRTLLNTIADAIIRLNKERNYTFVVIEHDMDFIEKLCDPVICMAEGKVLAKGSLKEIKSNENVIEAYLGTGLKNKVL